MSDNPYFPKAPESEWDKNWREHLEWEAEQGKPLSEETITDEQKRWEGQRFITPSKRPLF